MKRIICVLFFLLCFAFSLSVFAQSGTITTYAGNGTAGFGGDGGLATTAVLNGPTGVAVDAAGNLFIVDRGNNRVRKVTPGGVISTVAGNGTAGFSGDGGQAIAAALNSPSDVAVDAAGNLFIADVGNSRVRKVTPDGVISTVAFVRVPTGVAVDAAGNLFIADPGDNSLFKVTAGGQFSNIGCCDWMPSRLAVDAAGVLYLSEYDNHVVSNSLGGFVGDYGRVGFSGDGGPASSAALNSPNGVAADVAGNLFIADSGNHRVRKVTALGLISTVAGNGGSGSNGDGGPATSAQIGVPAGVAVDAAGNLFIADTENNRIRKVEGRPRPEFNGGHDFNGDGRSDILFRDTAGNVSVLLLNGYSITSNTFIANIWNGWTIAGTGDFNGDGKTDILWRDAVGNVATWLMDGAVISSFSGSGNMPATSKVAGVADFNGDGKSDILWRDANGNVAMWLMNGHTITSSSVIANIWTGWTIVGIGDFNGGGKADILWRDTAGNLAIWLMDGTTVSSHSSVNGSISTLPLTWAVAGIADFDGDGAADILWRDTTGHVAMWLMDGTTVTNIRNIATIPTAWTITGTGDFNGDIKADILWRDTDGNVAIWLMDGPNILSYSSIGNVSDRKAQ